MLPHAGGEFVLRRHLLNLEPPLENPGYTPGIETRIEKLATVALLVIYCYCYVNSSKLQFYYS